MKYLIPLTEHQANELATQIDTIKTCEYTAMRWANTAWELYQGGLWKALAPTWTEFCREHLGWNKHKACKWKLAGQFFEEQKQLSEVAEDVTVPVSVKQAHKLRYAKSSSSSGATQKKLLTKNPVEVPVKITAKLDPQGPPVEFNKPPEIPADWRMLIEQHWKHLDQFIHRQDLPMEALREAVRLAGEATKLRNLVQSVLPGFESLAKFRPPTLEEVQLFCAKPEVGICGSDANWFWNHMEGYGWTVDKKTVKSWQGVLRAWKTQRYLPSMKAQPETKGQLNGYRTTNGTGDSRSLVAKEMDRLTDSIQREYGRVSHR